MPCDGLAVAFIGRKMKGDQLMKSLKEERTKRVVCISVCS